MRARTLLLAVLAPLPLVTASSAPAPVLGPPAICFPIEIGDAESLPWKGAGAFDARADYDRARLAADATSILDDSDDAFVHMETLRRAAIYVTGMGGRKPSMEKADAWAHELLGRLRERAIEREFPLAGEPAPSARERALAWFDLGYAAGALRQIGWSVGDGREARRAIGRALELHGDEGALQLGAALALWEEAGPEEFRRHLGRAAELGREPGTPLHRNLLATAGRILGAQNHDELVAAIRRSGG